MTKKATNVRVVPDRTTYRNCDARFRRHLLNRKIIVEIKFAGQDQWWRCPKKFRDVEQAKQGVINIIDTTYLLIAQKEAAGDSLA